MILDTDLNVGDEFAFSLFWDDIRYFLSVARDGSLNSASKRLKVSHTTVSRRIKILEESLKVELFERQGNFMVMTEAGRQVFQEVSPMLKYVGNLERIVNNSSKIEGDVKIYVTEGIASFWLMPRMYDFQQKHPGLKINWFISNKDPFELGKDVDIAFRWSRPKEPYAIAKKLASVTYSMFATKEYIEKNGEISSFEDLLSRKIIHFGGYDVNPDLTEWNELMKKSSICLQIENSSAAPALLRSGEYTTLLPNYTSLIEPNLIKMNFDVGVHLDLWIAYHEDKKRSAKIKAVVDEIKRLVLASKGEWWS